MLFIRIIVLNEEFGTSLRTMILMNNIYLLQYVLDRQILLTIEKGEKTNNDLPDALDFSKVILKTLTISNPLCCCLICEIARFNTIGTSRGLAKAVSLPLGRPSVAPQDFYCLVAQLKCVNAVGSQLVEE